MTASADDTSTNEDIGDGHDDTGDVSKQLEGWIRRHQNDTDQEDAPDWQFEEQETHSSDSEYIFCPAPHRHQLLVMFSKHFCMHPAFPEEEFGFMTAADIRKESVWDMYNFCYKRGLREVWGYMWTQWYSPKKWKLWARSTSEHVSRLRTTMSVENHWRQLKHDYLHHLLRPRLDQLIYIIVTKVLPAYLHRAQVLEDNHALGRVKTLTKHQQDFKRAWKTLSERTVGGTDYHTDVWTWVCYCGQQKYNCFHLCKHLVQACQPPPSAFFHFVHRRRTQPLYRHQWLKPKEDNQDASSATAYTGEVGSITDGDDHIWLGDAKELKGDGNWRALMNNSANVLLKKRQRLEEDTVDDREVIPAVSELMEPVVTHLGDSEDDEAVSCFRFHKRQQLTSYTLQVEESFERLKQLAKDLRESADIIDRQINQRNALWARRLTGFGFGKDVSALVAAVRWQERTGRVRTTTWPRNAQESRKSRFLMGYLPSSSPAPSRASSPV